MYGIAGGKPQNSVWSSGGLGKQKGIGFNLYEERRYILGVLEEQTVLMGGL